MKKEQLIKILANNKKVRKNITINPELVKLSKKKNTNFSDYIEQLILKDILK